jgi:CRISPR-associated protein Cmr3
MSTEYRFLEPLDVLFLRGNKLFGDPGSYGEALIPPWPSVAAGAIRSRMLADEGVDLAAFARGEIDHSTLGSPARPGAFAITSFLLARRHDDGRVEALYPIPADLVVNEAADGAVNVRCLTPTPLPGGKSLQSSAPLTLLPVLAETERSKPAGGYWLSQSGWKKYLEGATPNNADLVKSDALWQFDPRVGVGLDESARRAADGRLFSVQAVAMQPGVGFITAVSGAMPPTNGTVRLGGDGRASAIQTCAADFPVPDYEALAHACCCRMVLTTPGLFTQGWLPEGVTQTDAGYRFELQGVKARLVCAAVPRAEVVSGWDLAQWQPKPAQRAAPSGCVYWLDELEANPEDLRKLTNQGLWPDSGYDATRRAEGFNRFTFAAF